MELSEHSEIGAALIRVHDGLAALLEHPALARRGAQTARNCLSRALRQIASARSALALAAMADLGEAGRTAYYPEPPLIDWGHLWSIADHSARVTDED
jgi:hypothetical protein